MFAEVCTTDKDIADSQLPYRLILNSVVKVAERLVV